MGVLPAYLSLGSAALITAPLAFIHRLPPSRIRYRYWGAAFAVFGISASFLLLPFAFPVLKVGHINWSGKIFSIAVVYTAVLSRCRNDPARRFMTFTQKEGTLPRSIAIVLLLLLFSVVISISERDGGGLPISREILLFEATLPGIDEEAVFRAAFMGYALAAVRGKESGNIRHMMFAVWASTLLFGLVHALHIDSTFHMHFDIVTFAVTGTVGLGLAILTLNSGSILLPVIAHNLANCVGMLV